MVAFVILAATLFLAPAVGATVEEVLQDTVKSFVVAAGVLAAALAYFLGLRRAPTPTWHPVLWLPLLLLAYATGSIAWSHHYLAGVEAVRWLILALLGWLALNLASRERLPALAWAIFAGASIASLWAVLQFCFDLRLFPQGRHPASTFVNRNFFAEYLVCALPFGAIVLARARRAPAALMIVSVLGLQWVALMMTATRAAMAAAALQALVLIWAGWRFRSSLPISGWSRRLRIGVVAVLVGTVVILGSLPTGSVEIAKEGRGMNAIARVLQRSWGVTGATDESMGVRQKMWAATVRLIQANPVVGVGAGAWESEIPLYESEEAQFETDYYAHNEYLQLVAEYGLVGWAFLLGLLSWLARLARHTLAMRSVDAAEAAWRAVLLASVLGLLVVSMFGFAWRLAATGAMLAFCLGALAASELRGEGSGWQAGAARARWTAWRRRMAACAAATALVATFCVGWIAVQAEMRLVGAARLALMLSSTGRPMDPRLAPFRERVQRLVAEGIALNPHYRKITPLIADEFARWGDWRGAVWIWEGVLRSRPHVVVMMANAGRGYAELGEPQRARAWLEAAKQVNPRAPAVLALERLLVGGAAELPKASAD